GVTDHHIDSGYDTARPRVLVFAGALRGGAISGKAHTLVERLDPSLIDISVVVNDSRHPKVQWNVTKLLNSGVRVIVRSAHTTFTAGVRYGIALDTDPGTRIGKRLVGRA